METNDISENSSISNASVDQTGVHTESTDSETDEEQLIVANEEANQEPRNIQAELDISKVLLRMVQGPFKVGYWPSIIIVRGLLIAAVPTVFEHDHSQVLAIMFILQVYLVLLNGKSPYKEKTLNNLESSLIFLLLFIGLVGITNLTYLSTTDDNIVDLLEQLNVLKFVVLLLPVPLLVTFLITDRITGNCAEGQTVVIHVVGDNQDINNGV